FVQIGTPLIFPRLQSASVRLRDVERLSGVQRPVDLTYHSAYRTNGFDATENPGAVWADTPFGTTGFTADKTGGAITPDLSVSALSRTLGAVSDAASVRQGRFEPDQFFDATAKFLGGILLHQVIVRPSAPVLTDPGADPPASLPQLQTEVTTRGTASVLAWEPELRDFGPFVTLDGTRARLRTEVLVDDDDPERSSTSVTGEITNFELVLPVPSHPLVRVPVDRFAFSNRTGQKPDIDVRIDSQAVEFLGELKFVAVLSEYLSFGLGPGPSITVSPTAIEMAIAAELPDVKLGVLTLSNLDLSAKLTIPLLGDPVTIDFAFASREDPFRVTVYGLGGGGYVLVSVGAEGLRRLELLLEAAAEVALDLGPISASISCELGLLISIEVGDAPEDTVAKFVGFFRMRGEVDCAIASASIELEMQLGYLEEGGKSYVYGRASRVIEISVFPGIGPPDIEIVIERKLKADPNDPPFAALMDAGEWSTYCNAFAPIKEVVSDVR
ncbi:MAG: hypothetical protein M3Q68_04200, partial [Actinomycetota bacterium]|nr:hypothetical protein [Actinomycetota bacterium]